MTQMKLPTKQKQTRGYREQTCGLVQWGGMEWVVGVSRCEVLYTERVNKKALPYTTGDYIQHRIINHNEKECIYMCN